MKQEWKLASFDTFCLGMVNKGAWIYAQAPDFTKMKAALKVIAGMYPQLGGLYDEKKKALVWDDAAATEPAFEVVDLLKYSTADLIGKPSLAWSLVPAYNINEFKEGGRRPFLAHLGYLKDGAILYVQCAHATMDGKSFNSLMNQWAELYRGGNPAPMTVNQDLLPSDSGFTKEETLSKILENGWVRMTVGKMFKMMWQLVRNNSAKGSFAIEVSQEEIARLKAESGSGMNAVLAAITLKRLAERLPKRESFKMLFVADLRGLYPGVDETFFGNFSQPFAVKGDFSVSESLPALAAAIQAGAREAVDSGKAIENTRLSLCSGKYSLPYFYFDPSDTSSRNPGTIYINNQLKFRACELDWGHGLPLYAFPNELPDMVKFWQPVAGGPVQLILGGVTAKLFR